VNCDFRTVLVVDDERSMRDSLRVVLSSYSYTVIEASTGEEAVALTNTAQFDAVLLDINMPGIDGIEVCCTMRKAHPRLPILMLSVEEDQDCKAGAFEAGAADFIAKPFYLGELTARLRAAVRRGRISGLSGEGILIGDLMLDAERRLVQKNGHPVHLNPKEFQLLHYLMANAGQAVTYTELLKSVWAVESRSRQDSLRTYIKNIRKKIEDAAANPKYLLTELNIGYRFSEFVWL
jgi:two-component system KDP operon response regulator KdpE